MSTFYIHNLAPLWLTSTDQNILLLFLCEGLFEHTHMQFELDRNDDTWGEPSLTEMVDKTIDILKRSEDGYFLLVEGISPKFTMYCCADNVPLPITIFMLYNKSHVTILV